MDKSNGITSIRCVWDEGLRRFERVYGRRCCRGALESTP